jgi:anti-sigma B factor antagonist
MAFQLHTRESSGVVIVDAVGKLTLTDGHTQLRDLIHVYTGNGSKRFVLNFARLEFIDSYGIGELARSYSIARRAGGDIKLASVGRRILDVLAISRLTTVFQIYSAENVAVESFVRH